MIPSRTGVITRKGPPCLGVSILFIINRLTQAEYYLPAWVDQVKVNNISADGYKVVVSVFNSYSVAFITRSFPETSSSISGSGFDKYLFPATDKITIEVE